MKKLHRIILFRGYNAKNKPHLVHVGSGLERGCPFLVADDTNKHIVTCNFMPDFFPGLVYDSK
jgi:hypothetical protein